MRTTFGALLRSVLDHMQRRLDAVDVSAFAGWQRRAGGLPQPCRRVEQVLERNIEEARTAPRSPAPHRVRNASGCGG